MTFSSPRRWLLLALLAAPQAWAALGEPESSIDKDCMHMRARRTLARSPQYAVHELTQSDGSRMRQFVSRDGRVFAVSWSAQRKPDLSVLMGASFVSYNSAAHDAASRGPLQTQFRHQGIDLVVQSFGRLNIFRGFAYRPSLLPKDVSLESLGLS